MSGRICNYPKLYACNMVNRTDNNTNINHRHMCCCRLFLLAVRIVCFNDGGCLYDSIAWMTQPKGDKVSISQLCLFICWPEDLILSCLNWQKYSKSTHEKVCLFIWNADHGLLSLLKGCGGNTDVLADVDVDRDINMKSNSGSIALVYLCCRVLITIAIELLRYWIVAIVLVVGVLEKYFNAFVSFCQYTTR